MMLIGSIAASMSYKIAFYRFQENEFFQENLRQNQKKLLKITRDRSYLLDRLLKYEPVDDSCESADEEEEVDTKKRKQDVNNSKTWNISKNSSENLNSSKTAAVPASSDDHLELVEKHLLARNETRMPVFASNFPRNIFDETDEV